MAMLIVLVAGALARLVHSHRAFKEHSYLCNDSLFSDAPCSSTLGCVSLAGC